MKSKLPSPRIGNCYGMKAYPSHACATWIESEMLCSDHGKFERRGFVRHSKTGKLVSVRLDVADTYFSIPATTASEHGYVTSADLGEYGAEFHFIPHTEQTQSPAEFRKETRAAYR